MKIYLASSWRNAQQPAVLAALRAAGHVVYDFRNPAPSNTGFSWKQCHATPPPWSAAETIEVLNTPRAIEGFDLDFNAMKWADAIVLLQPCGVSAALELGWGTGAGKLTIGLLADGQEPELMLRMADYLCTSVDEAIEVLTYGMAVKEAQARKRSEPGPARAKMLRGLEASITDLFNDAIDEVIAAEHMRQVMLEAVWRHKADVARDEGRRAGMEEAARIADEYGTDLDTPEFVANAIRAAIGGDCARCGHHS